MGHGAVPHRAVLLLLPRVARPGCPGDVGHRPLALRLVLARDPRKCRQGRIARAQRQALPLLRLPHRLGLWRRRRRVAGRAHRAGRSPSRLLDALRQPGLHAVAGGLRKFPRPLARRLRLHLPAGPGDVIHALLALRLRGHPRGRRRLLPARVDGPLVVNAEPLMALLEAISVTKFYGDVCALAGVSLAVAEGEFVSIIGPNGAGKTTLVNVLTGLSPPSSGAVRFKEHDVTGLGRGRLARLG